MPLPDHLFIADSDGCLYDTRRENWMHNRPLRSRYRFHCTDIDNTAHLKAALRAGQYTDLGGYPCYFITDDGGALSFDTVRDNLREVLDAIHRQDRTGGWLVIACQVNWEDHDLRDDHTGATIESAYGSDE